LNFFEKLNFVQTFISFWVFEIKICQWNRRFCRWPARLPKAHFSNSTNCLFSGNFSRNSILFDIKVFLTSIFTRKFFWEILTSCPQCWPSGDFFKLIEKFICIFLGFLTCKKCSTCKSKKIYTIIYQNVTIRAYRPRTPVMVLCRHLAWV
jgi:hypothetical protein